MRQANQLQASFLATTFGSGHRNNATTSATKWIYIHHLESRDKWMRRFWLMLRRSKCRWDTFMSTIRLPIKVHVAWPQNRKAESLISVQLKLMNESTLHLGLCLPKSCKNDQIHNLLEELFSSTQTSDELKPRPSVLLVKDLQLDSKFYLKRSVLLFVAVVLVIKLLERSAMKMDAKKKVLVNDKIALGLESRTEQSPFQKLVQCFNLTQIGNKSEATHFSVDSISGLKQVFQGFRRQKL